jgi:hypothetical protein
MAATARGANTLMEYLLLSVARRFPSSRGANLRKTLSAGIAELSNRPFQIAQLLITGAFVKHTIAKFDWHEVLNITQEHVQARVDHFSNILNWTFEDFRLLQTPKEKELVLQSLFPAILENTLAGVNLPLHYDNSQARQSADEEGQLTCTVCLTQGVDDFHITLPESREKFQCCGGMCSACVRNREVAELSRFIDRDRSFWLLNRHSDSISLVNAASSAYGSMLMKEQLRAAHSAQTALTQELSMAQTEEEYYEQQYYTLPAVLSSEDASYFDSLAAFSQ